MYVLDSFKSLKMHTCIKKIQANDVNKITLIKILFLINILSYLLRNIINKKCFFLIVITPY